MMILKLKQGEMMSKEIKKSECCTSNCCSCGFDTKTVAEFLRHIALFFDNQKSTKD
jgi:hypothetical protein